MIKIYDVCIIGAGVIGAAITKKLSEFNLTTITLEKNPKVAMETSQGNSGLIHSGIDPTPGKLNAKLNLLGNKIYQKWFKELSFPHKKIPTLIIAFNKKEDELVKQLYKRGLTNGLNIDELKILSKPEIMALEPNLSSKVTSGVLATNSFMIDPVILTRVLLSNAIKNKALLKLNAEVTGIKWTHGNYFEININTISNPEVVYSKYIINVSGHYADVLSKKAGYYDFDLTSKRGEYRVLEKTNSPIVNNLIFLIPTIHGKGVLVAPMLDGRTLVGPTAESNVPKEDTRLVTKKNV